MPSLSCSLSSFSRSPGFFSSSSPYLTPSAKVILPSSSLAAGLVTASAASSSALVPFKLSRKARILSLAAASKPGKSLSVISSTVAFSSISTPTSRGEYPPSTCASTTWIALSRLPNSVSLFSMPKSASAARTECKAFARRCLKRCTGSVILNFTISCNSPFGVLFIASPAGILSATATSEPARPRGTRAT